MAAEEEFITDMDKFITGYVIPLRDSGLLNRGEADDIFNNISELKEENNNLLASLMAANASNGLEMIGTLLLENVSDPLRNFILLSQFKCFLLHTSSHSAPESHPC